MSDFRMTEGEPAPLPSRKSRKRTIRRAIVLLFVTAVLLTSLSLIHVDQTIPAAGYVTTEDYAEVRAPRAGRIAEIRVRDGMDILAGDALVRLDCSEAEALLEQAGNQAERARARLARLNQVHEHNRLKREKALLLADLRFKDATAKLELAERLHERGLAPEIQVEDRRLATDIARVERESLEADDETLDIKELAVLEEELKAAESAVKLHRIRREEHMIKAPISGTALRHDFVIGEVVAPDAVLYEIFGGDLVMKLMIDERHSAHVGVGQAFRAQLAPFRGLRRIWFHGAITRVGEIVETSRNRTGIFVYGSFDPQSYNIVPGSSADVVLFTGKAPLWRVLLGVY